MDKQAANKILTNLDETADMIERLASTGRINKKVAAKLANDIDTFADKFQVQAFGKDSLRKHQAKVLKRDSDESFMDTFENPNKPIITDADEEYMHKVGESFNSDAIGTFDVDGSSSVSNRKETDVRDVSEWSNGTKPQKSWTGGRGGKSTRQSSTSGAKTWSE